ncbi:MAG: hypothetical protein HY719_07385 [Planctomycetes bacterium]|nr:hypothetical protein [Planctomycetota bacterium]
MTRLVRLALAGALFAAAGGGGEAFAQSGHRAPERTPTGTRASGGQPTHAFSAAPRRAEALPPSGGRFVGRAAGPGAPGRTLESATARRTSPRNPATATFGAPLPPPSPFYHQPGTPGATPPSGFGLPGVAPAPAVPVQGYAPGAMVMIRRPAGGWFIVEPLAPGFRHWRGGVSGGGSFTSVTGTAFLARRSILNAYGFGDSLPWYTSSAYGYGYGWPGVEFNDGFPWTGGASQRGSRLPEFDPADVRSVARAARESRARRAEARLDRGERLLKQGLYSRAGGEFKLGLAERRDDAALWLALGHARLALGEHEAAERALTEGLRLDPAHARGDFSLAAAFPATSGAVARIEGALANRAKGEGQGQAGGAANGKVAATATAFFLRGYVRRFSGRRAAASEDLRRALEEAPDHAGARALLGAER